ncbi:MAG TPA: TrbI/VirB10 family protein, partial [Alphaproteobacteria bacterium]|nr:TrbI/VirB10 family protein [Alphaproteobacteria bacterium]
MSMLRHEQTKERIIGFFKPESSQDIKRLQFFWLGCGLLGILALSYGIVHFLFEKAPLPQQTEEIKVTQTSIETLPSKVDLNEVFRHKIEDELKILSDEIKALQTLFQEGVKQEQSFPANTEEDDQSLTSTFPKDAVIQELETKILNLESQLDNQKNTFGVQGEYLSQSLEGQGDQPNNLIQKVSLGLTENPHLVRTKTVETTIPAGAFAKTVLLSGLDASSSMTASSDPRPMLLRIIDFGTLPRRFQSDLKDCHCMASAYGDLSSERVYARLEKLTCIERGSGEIIETQVAGYIAGSDGKAGIRGVVASKDGQFLSRSLMGGIFAGLSNVANPQNRQAQMNPFLQGSAQQSPPSIGDMFTSGMASGATTALDRLSQYYIDRAEQLQPVIQIAAGQLVDIVFTEGTFIGSQVIKDEIKNAREESR